MGLVEDAVTERLALVDRHPGLVARRTRPGAPTEVRVDLRGLLGEQPAKAACREVAEAVVATGDYPRHVVIPPVLFVDVALPVLYDAVVGGVLRQGRGYGDSVALAGHSAIVAFSCPNTNKPLHVGHLRNNFIGMTLVRLFESQGAVVHRQSPHNDFGIHHTQAVLAWLKWGGGETPESSGVKGDHLVGRYYAMFHARNAEQRRAASLAEDESEVAEGGATDLEREALDLLGRMEAGDPELLRVNWLLADWADAGIKATYRRIGTWFEGIYYDRDHLEMARRIVDHGVRDGVFAVREDGSVYVDLTEHALGQVTLRRADGTPLSWRHWLAYDISRYTSTRFDTGIHLLGRQWASGFFVFRHLLRMLGHDWIDRVEGLFHGMVSLPEGRVRSREGGAASGDELFDRVRDRLLAEWAEAGDAPAPVPARELCDVLGVALVKYHLLKAKRDHAFVHDEEAMWGRALPDLARALRLLASTRAAPVAGPPTWRHDALPEAAKKALRRLLYTLDDLPDVVQSALERREPIALVRLIDDVTRAAAACRRALPADDPVWRAVAIVLAKAFALLNVELPSLEALPPAFAGGRTTPTTTHAAPPRHGTPEAAPDAEPAAVAATPG